MLTFNDLVFKAPDKAAKYTIANLLLPNGYGVRVVHFKPRWELSVTVGGKPVWDTPIGDRVQVCESPEEVSSVMERVQQFDPAF